MSETQPSRRISRSIGAVLAGIVVGIMLSIGTDAALRAAGIFPPLEQPAMSNALFMLATGYRIIYGIVGSYIIAWLAPDRRHSSLARASQTREFWAEHPADEISMRCR